MLTHQQNNLLKFIRSYYDAHGVMPSLEEMRIGLELRSKSGIHRILEALEERGWIRRLYKRSRAIELVDRATAAAEPLPRSVPLVARTGQAALNSEGRLGRVEPPAYLVGAGEHIGIVVSDDSMRRSGILRGDVAMVRKQDFVPVNDIALVRADGMGHVLRRCKTRGPAIALHPDAPGEEMRILPRSSVCVVGRLVGILRDYR